MRQLRPAHALVLRRVVVDGRSLTDVAEELGISVNAMTVRVHHAREAPEERLRTHCGTDSLRACIDCVCTERGCCVEQRA